LSVELRNRFLGWIRVRGDTARSSLRSFSINDIERKLVRFKNRFSTKKT